MNKPWFFNNKNYSKFKQSKSMSAKGMHITIKQLSCLQQ